MADLLRDLADLIDQKMGSSDPAANNRTQQLLDPVEVPKQELPDNPVMVPPLQAKLEILKKSEGIPNVYDSEGGDDQTDELSMIKMNAGLSVAQQEASEDNDITG